MFIFSFAIAAVFIVVALLATAIKVEFMQPMRFFYISVSYSKFLQIVGLGNLKSFLYYSLFLMSIF
jgi:hypothetical protein